MSNAELLAWIGAINVVSIGLLGLFLKGYFDQKGKNRANREDASGIAYETEHGKNLATKEDIGRITVIVEEIKAQHTAEIEALKSRHQLRVAAIEKRLQAHQEAFTLWRRLVSQVHESDIFDVCQECQTWWDRNCLYLEPNAREAFSAAYWAASVHQQFSKSTNRADAVSLIMENWEKIQRAGELIVAAVSLPGLTEPEKKDLRELEEKDLRNARQSAS